MEPEIVRLLSDRKIGSFTEPFSANLVSVRRFNQPLDTFDGSIYLYWKQALGGSWHLISADCATRPGSYYLKNPLNSNGTSLLCPGRHTLSHALGSHKGTPALVQVGSVTVKRDNNKNVVLDPSDKLWNDASGINIHQCSNPAYLAGCQGVPQIQLTEILEAFKFLQSKRPQDRVSLTLIEI